MNAEWVAQVNAHKASQVDEYKAELERLQALVLAESEASRRLRAERDALTGGTTGVAQAIVGPMRVCAWPEKWWIEVWHAGSCVKLDWAEAEVLRDALNAALEVAPNILDDGEDDE